MISDILRPILAIYRRLFRSGVNKRTGRQQIPQVSPEDVIRIVRRDFPESQFEEVMAVLNQYGIEKWEREKKPRVQLATLKLANGSFEKLRKMIKLSKEDFRDVLAPAEYPEYGRNFSNMQKVSAKEYQRILDNDWKQYQNWLQR